MVASLWRSERSWRLTVVRRILHADTDETMAAGGLPGLDVAWAVLVRAGEARSRCRRGTVGPPGSRNLGRAHPRTPQEAPAVRGAVVGRSRLSACHRGGGRTPYRPDGRPRRSGQAGHRCHPDRRSGRHRVRRTVRHGAGPDRGGRGLVSAGRGEDRRRVARMARDGAGRGVRRRGRAAGRPGRQRRLPGASRTRHSEPVGAGRGRPVATRHRRRLGRSRPRPPAGGTVDRCRAAGAGAGCREGAVPSALRLRRRGVRRRAAVVPRRRHTARRHACSRVPTPETRCAASPPDPHPAAALGQVLLRVARRSRVRSAGCFPGRVRLRRGDGVLAGPPHPVPAVRGGPCTLRVRIVAAPDPAGAAYPRRVGSVDRARRTSSSGFSSTRSTATGTSRCRPRRLRWPPTWRSTTRRCGGHTMSWSPTPP